MKDLYPRYADRVNLVAVGVDAAEGPDVLRAYQQQNGYSWTFAPGSRDMLERYNVVTTMSQYVMDERGIVITHGGHTVKDRAAWEQVFQQLERS